jgi:hypothetical protein
VWLCRQLISCAPRRREPSRVKCATTGFLVGPRRDVAVAHRRHFGSSSRATSTPTRRSLPRRAARSCRGVLRRPSDRSQARGDVLHEGTALPRLSGSSSEISPAETSRRCSFGVIAVTGVP